MNMKRFLIVFVIMIGLVFTAFAKEPTYATATVDGGYGEWNLSQDFFANMYRAFKPDKPIESYLYLRYDCAKEVVYVLVLAKDGVPGINSAGDAWIAIDGISNKVVNGSSGNNGVPPDFSWVGIGYDNDPTHVRGYEASFPLTEGSYLLLAHLEVYDDGASQTSGTDKDGLPLEIECPPASGEVNVIDDLNVAREIVPLPELSKTGDEKKGCPGVYTLHSDHTVSFSLPSESPAECTLTGPALVSYGCDGEADPVTINDVLDTLYAVVGTSRVMVQYQVLSSVGYALNCGESQVHNYSFVFSPVIGATSYINVVFVRYNTTETARFEAPFTLPTPTVKNTCYKVVHQWEGQKPDTLDTACYQDGSVTFGADTTLTIDAPDTVTFKNTAWLVPVGEQTQLESTEANFRVEVIDCQEEKLYLLPLKIWQGGAMPGLSDLVDFKITLDDITSGQSGYSGYNSSSQLTWYGVDPEGLPVKLGDVIKVAEQGIPKGWKLKSGTGNFTVGQAGFGKPDPQNPWLIYIEIINTVDVDDFKVGLRIIDSDGNFVAGIEAYLYMPGGNPNKPGREASSSTAVYGGANLFFSFQTVLQVGTAKIRVELPTGPMWIEFEITADDVKNNCVYIPMLQEIVVLTFPKMEQIPAPIYPQDFGTTDNNNQLVFISGSPCNPEQNWDNAVDGDIEGWDGTATVKPKGDQTEDAWAIFEFADQGSYQFDYVIIQTDNGTADDKVKNRQAEYVDVLVSQTDTSASSFVFAKNIWIKNPNMTWYNLGQMFQAKYIKLVILNPKYGRGGWRQIVEFGVSTKEKNGAVPVSEDMMLAAVPEEFKLNQNYPNPFNAETTIEYALPQEAAVQVLIYDMMGQRVALLVNEQQQPGVHRVVWNAVDFPSGRYFCVLTAGEFKSVKRLTLLK